MVSMILGSISEDDIAGLAFHATAGPSLVVLLSVLPHSNKKSLEHLAKKLLKIQKVG